MALTIPASDASIKDNISESEEQHYIIDRIVLQIFREKMSRDELTEKIPSSSAPLRMAPRHDHAARDCRDAGPVK